MTDHATVLADIIASRGGDAAFSIEQRAIASALAHAMVSAAEGDASAAATIAPLSAPLPPKVGGLGAPDERLPRLTDTELEVQFHLLQRLDGMDEASPSSEATPWHLADRLQRDLDASRLLVSQFARENERLCNELAALRSTPVTVPDAPAAEAPPATPDNVVELRPPASPFAGLGASITGPLPPHAARGPEYSP